MLTALSYIDIAVVLDRELGREERAEVIARLWEELERLGIPPHYPLYMIVLSGEKLDRLTNRKERLGKTRDSGEIVAKAATSAHRHRMRRLK